MVFRCSSIICKLALKHNKLILVASILFATTIVGVSYHSSGHDNYFFHTSELGKIASVKNQQSIIASGNVEPDPQGVELLEKAVVFPDLPADFKLDDYNILLVVVDALRYDLTSLNMPELNTTPKLKKFAETGWSATSAYAPSSGTLHSMSSLMTMKYPSATSVESWVQPWNGRLSPDEITVAELFKIEKRHTFWIGHNLNYVFDKLILGIKQGFDEVNLLHDDGDSLVTDTEVAKLGIKKLEKVARAGTPFFGMLFFVSPHAKYMSHGFSDLPSKTNKDKYLQELRNFDNQFAKVMASLSETKLIDNTIVIVVGDHGEEFNEHGGTHHQSTVYGESTKVPLIVRVPGMVSGVFDAPVNTSSVLPWLLLRSKNDKVRSHVESICKTVIGPYLRASKGAAISELIGRDMSRTALTYDKWRIIYNHRSKLYELYDLIVDPSEQDNLFDKRPEISKRLQAIFEEYLRVRGQSQKTILAP